MKQNETKTQNALTLTARQLKAIPFVVSSPTYTEAIEKARVSRKTFYEWLKQPEFKAEINQQRNEITAEAFGILSQGLTKAVENLVKLLDHAETDSNGLLARMLLSISLSIRRLRT